RRTGRECMMRHAHSRYAGGGDVLTVGSLFAGIGGIDLGLERAGMQVRWQVEIDDYCRRVLAKHWPEVTRYADIRDVGAHNLEPVDLIAGGFPCQDISFAGKGAGINGERSGLWREFARVVRELRPRYVLVENSSALTFRGLGDVLADLAVLGYDAEWSVLSACALGAPHTRERLFVVAYRDCPGLQTSGPGGDRDGAAVSGRRAHSEHLHPVAVSGSGSGRTHWSTEPPVGRMADGVSKELDRHRLRALGKIGRAS